MKFRLMKFIYINLFFFILIFFSFKENLSAKNFEANYIVEVGNVDLGTLRWLLDIDENNYKTSIFLQDKGLLSLFYKFDGKYYSEGSIYNNDFLPQFLGFLHFQLLLSYLFYLHNFLFFELNR